MSTPVVLSSPDHEVEELLQSDQSGSYPRTDNETRLRCHGVIARFQMRTALPRVEIARRALSVARAKSEPVEYFLVGEGASGFARDLGIRPSWRERAAAIIRRYAAGLYHPIVLCAAVGIAFLALEAARTAGAGAFFSTLVGLSVVTVALSYASAILRWATLAVVPIRSCARVMPCHASPDGEVLLLVLPVVISNAAHAHQLVGRLATLERTMNDPAVRFAMVSDFDDAATQAADGDVEIIMALRTAIDTLNMRSRDALGDRFFALHRRRSWNNTQRAWLGWERKRGKIIELLRLLRGEQASATNFEWILGDLSAMLTRARVRYMLSLDEQTSAPRDLFRELVRAAIHPLNRGHGIVQPTLTFAPAGIRAEDLEALPASSRFRRGVPEFHRDVLDVPWHQGAAALYDVEACAVVLDGAFPPERVLQHDLLDGFMTNALVLSDVYVYQSRSAGHLARWSRGDRWLRGTFQLLPWALPYVRSERNRLMRNPLRRTCRACIVELFLAELTVAASVLSLLMVWILPFAHVAAWTVSLAPPLAGLLAVAPRVRIRSLPHAIAAATFSLAALAFEATLAVNAFTRTSWRMAVTRRHLLDWTASRAVERNLSRTCAGYVSAMWASTAVGIAALALVARLHPSSLPVATPIALLWVCAPLLTCVVDRAVAGQPPSAPPRSV